MPAGPQPVIRTGLSGDEPALAELIQRAWPRWSLAHLIEQIVGPRGDRPWHRYKFDPLVKMLRESPEPVLVAELDGRVVGYATFKIDRDRRIGIVGDNAVDPAAQGRGVASALHRAVLRRIKEADVDLVEVSTVLDNEPARRMYEKHGFRELRRSITYIARPEELCSEEGG